MDQRANASDPESADKPSLETFLSPIMLQQFGSRLTENPQNA